MLYIGIDGVVNPSNLFWEVFLLATPSVNATSFIYSFSVYNWKRRRIDEEVWYGFL